METDICPAKHLEMSQRTRWTRLSARRAHSSRQGFHASVPRRQRGRHIGDSLGLLGKEQSRQDGRLDETAHRLIHALPVSTMPPVAAGADASES